MVVGGGVVAGGGREGGDGEGGGVVLVWHVNCGVFVRWFCGSVVWYSCGTYLFVCVYMGCGELFLLHRKVEEGEGGEGG